MYCRLVPSEVDKITSVTFELHPTFVLPSVTLYTPNSQIVANTFIHINKGWGEFMVQVNVVDCNGALTSLCPSSRSKTS